MQGFNRLFCIFNARITVETFGVFSRFTKFILPGIGTSSSAQPCGKAAWAKAVVSTFVIIVATRWGSSAHMNPVHNHHHK